MNRRTLSGILAILALACCVGGSLLYAAVCSGGQC